MKYISENFRSINELLNTLATRKINKVFENERLASETGDKEFTKTKSYAEAIELLKNGYTEPLAEIKRGVETNARGIIAQKTAVKNDVVGYAPCVPNAILGIPQSMINKQMAAKKSKIITIIHDADAAAGVKADTFIKAGIATLTIVNSLEARGYRVSLKVVFNNSSEDNEKLFATVVLKDWRQPLDFKKITFPFCHPSMLRRIGFRYLETQPQVKESGYTCGYGRADPTANSYKEMVKILRDNHLIADHEKYINIKLCEEKGFNPQEIAKACGLENPETVRKPETRKPKSDEPLKVGDKVRILDGSKIKDYAGSWNGGSMREHVGDIRTIKEIGYLGSKKYARLNGVSYMWDLRGLERV